MKPGTLYFYRPDPSGPTSPLVITHVADGVVGAKLVGSGIATRVSPEDLMPLEDMLRDTYALALPNSDLARRMGADMAASILKERISTLGRAVDYLHTRAESSRRVLVTVTGGVAEVFADPGVEVVVFDRDNYAADPVATGGVPPEFEDLAERADVPVARAGQRPS